MGLREGEAPRAQQALREGEDVAVERRDRSAVGDRGRSGEGRARERGQQLRPRRGHGPRRHAVREVDREGVDQPRHRVAELDAQPVHARRARRAAVHREDRRDRSVDRREVLRVDAGDGRSSSRRGVRQVPRHEAVGPLPDQRAPEDAARRHRQRQPLGHDLPRHADHGRGSRARRVRVHPPAHDRAAAQAAAPLRDVGRSVTWPSACSR